MVGRRFGRGLAFWLSARCERTNGSRIEPRTCRWVRFISQVGGAALTERHKMGPLDTETMEMAVIDITPTIQKEGEEDESADERDSSDDDDQQDWFRANELAIPARPKLDIEMPYRSYKLVYTNGQPVERVDKHPFCMSRVYYDGKEQPNEVLHNSPRQIWNRVRCLRVRQRTAKVGSRARVCNSPQPFCLTLSPKHLRPSQHPVAKPRTRLVWRSRSVTSLPTYNWLILTSGIVASIFASRPQLRAERSVAHSSLAKAVDYPRRCSAHVNAKL